MDVARRLNASTARWDEISFIDDICATTSVHGARVFKFDDGANRARLEGAEVVIANGEPAARQAIRARVENAGIRLGTVVDLSTLVSETAKIGAGVVITPLCSISCNVLIGTNATVNTMSILGHDVTIGDNTVISSMVNVGGACTIGADTYIGMGALIKEKITIGRDVIVGMGAVVYNDIPDGMIALGNPARAMRANTDKKVFK